MDVPTVLMRYTPITRRLLVSRAPGRTFRSALLPVFAGWLYLAAFAFPVGAQFVELAPVNTGAMATGEWATQVVSSRTGKEIITAGVDGRVVIWDAATGKASREVLLPSMVLALSLSQDGSTLAAGDASGTISIIDTGSATVKNTFAANKTSINALVWSGDGKFVAAGAADGIVRIWSAGDEKTAREINPGHGNIVSLVFANAQLVIGMIDFKERNGVVEIWDWQNKKLLRSFDEGTPAPRAMSVSADGKFLAVASFRRVSMLHLLSAGGSSFEATLRLLPDPDGPTGVAIWDMALGKMVRVFDADTGARSVAFSPDGRMLACSGPNGAVIYEVAAATFAEIGRLDSMTSIDAVAFTPDSKQLLIVRQREPMARFGEGGLDKLFDPFFTSVVMVVREGTSPSFAINTKEKRARSLTGGSTVEIWQVRPRTAPQELKTWDAVRAIFDKKPDEAWELLQQVIKDHPAYGEAQRIRVVFFETGDMKKAQSLIEAAVKADPDCVACWRTLGDIQHNNKQDAEALKSFDRALQLRPEYGLVAGRLAEAHASVALSRVNAGNDAKNLSEAEQGLLRALALRPAEEKFYTNLSTVYYFRGDFDRSISSLLIAQRLRPDAARIYYNLGHSYRQKGDKPRALEAYRRYVQIGEEGEDARIARAKEYINQLSK